MKLVFDKNIFHFLRHTVIILMVTVFGVLAVISIVEPVFAQTSDNYGLKATAVKGGLITGDEDIEDTFATQIGRLIGPVIGLSGSIFFALVVYAGILWMTAAGNEEQVGKAKKVLSAAVAGLAIVVLAYAITKFVGDLILPDAPSSPPSTS